MKICKNCASVIEEYRTAVEVNRQWVASEPSLGYCCECPSPIEIDDGDLSTYEDNWDMLDMSDLTEKEEAILKYLNKEGRIPDVYEAEIHEEYTTNSVVRDKQLWLDLL